jgi:hypothetical protein
MFMLALRIALAFPTSASHAGNTTGTEERHRRDPLANAEFPPPSIEELHLRIRDCFPHSDRSPRVGDTDAKGVGAPTSFAGDVMPLPPPGSVK